jgi:hypothetical protein
MTPWLLLALTLACAFLTFDAFRLNAPMKDAPYSHMPGRWKHGFNHLSLAEQDEAQNRSRFYSSLAGMGVMAWLFLAITLLFALLTVGAFLA